MRLLLLLGLAALAAWAQPPSSNARRIQGRPVCADAPADTNVLVWSDADGCWKPSAAGSGSGDVVGPASATDGGIACYDGATGKLLKDCSTGAGAGAIQLAAGAGTASTAGFAKLTTNASSHALVSENTSTPKRILQSPGAGLVYNDANGTTSVATPAVMPGGVYQTLGEQAPTTLVSGEHTIVGGATVDVGPMVVGQCLMIRAGFQHTTGSSNTVYRLWYGDSSWAYTSTNVANVINIQLMICHTADNTQQFTPVYVATSAVSFTQAAGAGTDDEALTRTVKLTANVAVSAPDAITLKWLTVSKL